MARKKQNAWIQSFAWERFIASRYLVSKKRDRFVSIISGFSFLGICLGVATLIIVMSVMGGFRTELLNRIIGMKGHVLVYSPTGNVPDRDEIVRKIQIGHNVKLVCPLIERQAVAMYADQTRGAIILGMQQNTLVRRKLLFEHLQVAKSPAEQWFVGNVVILGKRLMERMGAQIGDLITLMNPEGDATPFGSVPRQQDFRIMGMFEVGMMEYDKNMILMPLDAAQDFFKMEKSLTQIEVFTHDVHHIDGTVRLLNSILIPHQLKALSWKHSDSQFFQALTIERNVMFLILMLIVIIASFNIISGQVMLVRDKTQDIAILKTLGAGRGAILRIFMMTGSVIGIVGTLCGTFLGIVVTLNLHPIVHMLECITRTPLFNPEVYFLSALPYRLDMPEIISIALTAICLSILAAIYPAFRAARMDPVEALRNV